MKLNLSSQLKLKEMKRFLTFILMQSAVLCSYAGTNPNSTTQIDPQVDKVCSIKIKGTVDGKKVDINITITIPDNASCGTELVKALKSIQ
jgi:hypothetical protein